MNWARVKRVATSLVILTTAAALGSAIVNLIFGSRDFPDLGRYEVGTWLAIGGIWLLIVKDLLLALLKTWSYIWDGNEAAHPKSGEAAVWLIEAIIASAILTVALSGPETDCPSDWTTCVEKASSLSPGCFHTCMRDREVDHLTAQITQAKDEIKLRFDTVATRVGELVSAHDAKTATTLNGINVAVAKTIQDSLAGLEGRIVDALSNKLLAAGCTLTSSDECPPIPCPPPAGDDCPAPPPPLEVKPRYTLLYENARLDEDGKVTAQSLGVKLERRHLERLKLLTAAFKDCNHADAPVEFNVTGFSSTAEFRFQPSGGTMPDSTHLNLEAANLRGQLVGAYLKNEQGFVVHWERWSSVGDMPRPYQGVEQQALNRTVFIDLKSAGACDFPRTNAQRPAQLPVPGQSP